jgi:hypothetical protein
MTAAPAVIPLLLVLACLLLRRGKKRLYTHAFVTQSTLGTHQKR